jgi:hypothetical protein
MILRKEFRVMTVFNRISTRFASIAIVLVGIADPAVAGFGTIIPIGPVGAPGPIAGVGLPILAAVGLGAYWLVKRYRDKTN